MVFSDPFDPFEVGVEDPVTRDTSSFLENIISKQGFYFSPGGKTTGRPSTKQEEAFILDFMQTRDRAPTMGELERGFSRGFNVAESEFLPGSTMGRLGFQTQQEYLAAQRAGETFGPHAGGLVPEGGIVVTDKAGNPIQRFADPSRAPRHFIESGQYIQDRGQFPNVPAFLEAGDVSLDTVFEQVYPQFDRGPFQEPSMEEALGRFSPEQVYQARLEDFVRAQLEQDRPKVEQLERQLEAAEAETTTDAEISQIRETFKREKDQLMTFDRAESLLTQAAGLLGKGTQAQDLSELLFGAGEGGDFTTAELPDIGGVTGASVQELFNVSLQESQAAFEKQQKAIPEFTGYPEPDVPTYPTGREEVEFYSYVEKLGLAPEYQNWLKGEYWALYGRWLAAKGQADFPMSFVSFVNDYLSRGG